MITLTKNYPPLREVTCYYENGDIVETSMASGLTDDDINRYFLNKFFNIRRDDMVKCIRVDITKENA